MPPRLLGVGPLRLLQLLEPCCAKKSMFALQRFISHQQEWCSWLADKVFGIRTRGIIPHSSMNPVCSRLSSNMKAIGLESLPSIIFGWAWPELGRPRYVGTSQALPYHTWVSLSCISRASGDDYLHGDFFMKFGKILPSTSISLALCQNSVPVTC